MSVAIMTKQASRTIGNLDVHFLPSAAVGATFEIESRPEPPLTKLARMSFPSIKLDLLFDNDKLTYLAPCADQVTRDQYSLAEALTHFIMFATLLKYNIVCPPDPNEADRWDKAPESERIAFDLCRAVKKPFEDERGKGWYPAFEPHVILLDRGDMETYLSALNYELALGIVYFLRGCESAEYCLVEWYKALEVVRHYFGGEKQMTQSLSPHGFDLKDFKKLTRYANDNRKPLSIGRHAPRKGASVIELDMHRLEHPMAEQVFKEAWAICRAVVEAFMNCLASQAGGRHASASRTR